MIIDKKDRSPSLPERRIFLSKIWITLGVVAFAELMIGGISFFVSGRKGGTDTSQKLFVDAGQLSDFNPGTVTLVHAANCYLSRLDDGGLLAISRKCTHLGCAVPWVVERGQFECPCHASVFDSTGNVIQSPASRALDIYPITLNHDRIMIDTSKPVKRSVYNAEQLFYPQELG